MKRLRGQDATFLYIESPSAPMHVAGIAVLDPSTCREELTFERFVRLTEERLHLVPFFRQKVVQDPLGLHHPVWVDDDRFDIEYHIRRAALPSPGGPRELAAFAAEVCSRPLDRSRALWELYVVEGLEGGHLAMVNKTHHAAIDGIAGTELATIMLDVTPDIRPVEPPKEPWQPEPTPSGWELLGEAASDLARQPLRLARWVGRGAARALQERFQSPRPAPADAGEPLTPARGPRTSLNTTITPHRKLAFTSVPLGDVKYVKSRLGGTVNDVVLALCSSALRQYFEDRGEKVDEPLIAAVPVSVRAEDEKGEMGNRMSIMNVALENHVADPVERLRRIQAVTRDAKERHHAIGAETLQNLQEFMPPAVIARASRLVNRFADRLPPPVNLTISNVPGPPMTLYTYGARMVATYPLGPVLPGSALNITVTSFTGKMFFGFHACRETVGDLWKMASDVEDALDELKKRAAEAPGD